MRYWVYINGKVLEKPFEEGELASIQGFTADTLICKETPAEGETQEWVPAKTLIVAYKQPVPPPPPTQQNINKFNNGDSSSKEQPQATILSGNIFGSSEDSKINLYKKSTPSKNKEEKTDFTQTEAIFPQEKAALEEDISTEPTELVSIDDVKEVDVDNHNILETESEDDILKTAIKKLITPTNSNKSKDKNFQAIDIAHNRNIDLSDPEEEEDIDKLVSGLKDKKEEEVKKEEDKKELSSEKQKDIANTELTLMGASKTGINHLFAVDVSQDSEEETSNKQNVSEEKEKAVPTETKPEEQKPQEEQKPLSEDEFVPEEEISLEEDDFIVEDLNNNDKDVLTKEAPSTKEQEVLKELAADKEEDIKVAQAEEEELEEAFKTAPALVSEFPQERKMEQIMQESNDILAPSQEIKSVEDVPTTLEELTGKFPLPQEAEVKPVVKEEQKDEGFIPTELHPDIIVEEVKEEVKEEPVKQEEAKPKPEDALEKDNFLTTFSSDIETVFLDQPTAFISDYIPPEETKEKEENEPINNQKDSKDEILDIKSTQGQHQVQNVRRVKPAAIKTVPMVDGEQLDPFSKTQIRNIEAAEENMIRIEKKNDRMNIALTLSLFLVLILLVIGFFGLIAQFGIMPKDFSPIHVVISKVFKKSSKKNDSNNKLTPEELALKDLKDAETLRINKIISEVKNYKLIDGRTLEEKIKLLHPNVYDTLKWEASQLPTDLTYYSVTVTSPANPEGFSQVNYRFNYNTVTYTVEATTSESNNVMVAPLPAASANTKK